ncbi:MAG: NUDIX hydrolase [Bacteroidota bacterium]
MLLFYCTTTDQLDKIRRKGLSRAELYTSFADASKACKELILVIQGYKTSYKPADKKGRRVKAGDIAPEAILNIDPYLPPSEVVAGGGFVMREGNKEPEVLMIFRKGVWDLPKGKLDDGESIEECALREVREEVGIKKLAMVSPLGTTVHGYPRKNKYKVKTTYWYQMETPERSFVPQAEEQIEKVEWMPWSKALDKIGYEIFRRHMLSIKPVPLSKV